MEKWTVSNLPKQVTTIKIDSKLWENFRVYCVRNKKYSSELIENLIRRFLDEENEG